MSTSQGSSVASWLSEHPHSPRDYLPIYEPSNPRKRNISRVQRDGTSKRSKLNEMSHNIREEEQRPASARKLGKQPASGKSDTPGPLKRRTRGSAAPSAPLAQRSVPLAPVDEEATPKAKSKGSSSLQEQLWPVPTLDPGSSSPARPGRQIDSSRGSTSQTTRSRSPTKQVGDFQLSNARVEIVALGTPGYPIPDSVKTLFRDMRAISNARGVLPAAIKATAVAELEDLVDDINFAPPDVEDGEKLASRGGLNHDSFWERVHEILDATLECKNRALGESSWNSEVHSSILRLALRGWWQSKDIWYCDITSAKIHDATLLPSLVSGTTMQSKMVDYAMVLEKPRDIYEDILQTLIAEGRPSINHSRMAAIRFSPIAVSIETKRGAVEEDTAYVQMGLWVAAHFARLRQLIHDNGPVQLPVLPLVMVLGAEWRLMVAEAREESGKGTIVYEHVVLGVTTSMLGIYQVIAALRRLARWVDEEYKPWFKRQVLAMG